MNQRRPFFNLLSAVLAASFAILTMFTLFATESFPEILGALMLQIIVVTTACAILIGLVNLLSVHLNRIGQANANSLYSLVVIVSATVVILARVLDIRASDDESVALYDVLFQSVQVSLEAALGGLLFFFLTYGAYRMLHRQVSLGGVFFIFVLVIVLLGWLPLDGLEVLDGLRDWIVAVPATSGARGILIGVALGTIAVGLRTLIGQEQAFREE